MCISANRKSFFFLFFEEYKMTVPPERDSYIKVKHFPDKLYFILNYLYKNGEEADLNNIKKEFSNTISKPVIKDIIFDLSMQNFVQEGTAKKDRRKKVITLTDRGKHLWQKLEDLSKIM